MDWADGGGGEKMDEDKETDDEARVKSGSTVKRLILKAVKFSLIQSFPWLVF